MNGPNRNERRHPVNPLGIPTSPHPDVPTATTMGSSFVALHEMYTEAMAAGFSRRDAISLVTEMATRAAEAQKETKACEHCGHTPS